jgi:O-antigen ligase
MRHSISPRDVPRLVRQAPVTAPMLVAVLLFAVWAGAEGGYPTYTWYPGAIFLLALLAATVVVVPGRLGALPRALRLAMLLFAAYTAWSYLSIAWADARGEAWDGANRTLLYLIVFVLFAAWSQRGETAAMVLGTWTAIVGFIALVVLLRISAAGDPLTFFIADRLSEPAGYPNAAAATHLMAFWPALLLASRREVPWYLRGLFAALAVILVDVALLSQSRGAFYSAPIAMIAFFVFVPGRVRSWATFVPIGIAIAVTVPGILDVGDALRNGEPGLKTVHGSALLPILAAMVAGLVIGGLSYLEMNRPPDPDRDYRPPRRLVAGSGFAAALAVVVIAIAHVGNPFTHVDDAWRSFKRGNPTVQAGTGSRLTAGFGSNRYDFYRVAISTWGSHPLWGSGADNYAADYLKRGRSSETPRYPHSIELRTLEQTGLIGGVLLLAAFALALATALAATRRRDRLSSAVAGGAAMVCVYWLLHGSFDWFWEFAGLGAPAFAMLGLACGLAKRADADESDADGRPSASRVASWIGMVPPPSLPGGEPVPARFVSGRGAILAGALAMAAALSFGAPWLAERSVQKAARTWPDDPAKAFDRLDSAARLNPLSDRPDLIAGSIALRIDDIPRARGAFESALNRNERGAYAALELGAIASMQGRPGDAADLLARASALSPRDQIAKLALRRVRAGKRVNVAELNRQILLRAARLVQ